MNWEIFWNLVAVGSFLVLILAAIVLTQKEPTESKKEQDKQAKEEQE